MAVIKHIASKSKSYSATMDYMEHEHDKNGKTVYDEDGKAVERFYLCDTINVQSKESYADECLMANKFYKQNQKTQDVKQHQYIISFSEDESKFLTPEEVLKIGREWAEQNLPGHQCILYVHKDGANQSGNMHVHVNCNSVRIAETDQKEWMNGHKHYYAEGKKHSCTADYRRECRASLDNILKERNLDMEVTKRSGKRIDNKEYHAKRRGEERGGMSFDTQKEELRQCIEVVAIKNTHGGKLDEEAYIKDLQEEYGIKVTESRGRYSYMHPEWDRKKPVSDRKLGEAYRKENLSEFSELENRRIGERHAEYERQINRASGRTEQEDSGTREKERETREGASRERETNYDADLTDSRINQLMRNFERREQARERERTAEASKNLEDSREHGYTKARGVRER